MTPAKNNHGMMPNIFSNFLGNDWLDTFNSLSHRVGSSIPAMNIKETDNAYIVELAAPGIANHVILYAWVEV